MARYEAHITLNKADSEKVKDGVGTWRYSAIDNDPLMGAKPFCYLTAYDSDPDVLYGRMELVRDELISRGIEVLRRKVERIIFDSRTGVDELADFRAGVPDLDNDGDWARGVTEPAAERRVR